jgi:hypothetical protein
MKKQCQKGPIWPMGGGEGATENQQTYEKVTKRKRKEPK